MKKIILTSMLLLSACGYGNLDYVKEHAEETLKANGFEVVGYQGYELGGVIPFTSYGGAYVWYTIQKPDNLITYEVALRRWGDEVHIYALKAKDAIAPNN